VTGAGKARTELAVGNGTVQNAESQVLWWGDEDETGRDAKCYLR
jgi:hypothetical protein